MSDLQVTHILSPLDRANRNLTVFAYRDGLTLADMRETLPDSVTYTISRNGMVVPESQWDTLVRPNDHVIFCPVLQGGGDKNIAATIAMVVVAFASYGLGAYIGGAMQSAAVLGYESIAAYSVAQAIVTTGLMYAGGMLVSSMFPVSTPDTQVPSPTYQWSPQNTQQQGMVIPRFYGENRVYGNVIGAYLSADGTKQYLSALISLGLGPINAVKRKWINDQPELGTDGTPTYADVEFHCRPGTLRQATIPYYNETKIERSVGITVTNAGGAQTYTTPGNTLDALEVEITAPKGVWNINDEGKYRSHTISVRVEAKQYGTEDWHDLSRVATTWTSERITGWRAGYWVAKATGWAWYNYFTGETSFANNGVPYHIDGQPYGYHDTSVVWRWFDNEQVDIATLVDNVINLTGSKVDVMRRTVRADNLPSGKYEIRLTKVTSDQNGNNYGDDLVLSAVREITTAPLSYPRIALASINALATEQLSGSLRASFEIEGALIRVWDGSSWSIKYSNNPAWVMYDILTMPVIVEDATPETVTEVNAWTGETEITAMVPNGDWSVARYDGIHPDKLDLAAFLELAEYCDELVPDGAGGQEKRFTFNGGFDTESNVWQAALTVGQSCFATPVWTGSKLTLIIDKPSDPVQLFTVGNTGIDSFKESFLPLADRASEIEVTYLDKTSDYAQTTATIVNGEITSDTSKIALQMIGTIAESQAWRIAQRRLAYNQYLTRTMSWQADIDSIACQVGDVVLLQSDVPQWGYGGRVVEVQSAYTLTLDNEVTFVDGTTYTMMVRGEDGTVQERACYPIGESPTKVVGVTEGFTLVNVYDVWAIGPSDVGIKPVRITDIARSGDYTCTLSAVDYYAGIYDTDSSVPVLSIPNYSLLTTYPVATNVTASDVWGQDNAGNLLRSLAVSWTTQSLARSWEVYYRTTGDWILGAISTTTSASIPNTIPATYYEIKVVGVNSAGGKTPDGQAPTITYQTAAATPPGDVSTLTATIVDRWVKLVWSPSSSIDVTTYIVRKGDESSSWETAEEITRTPANATEYLWSPNETGTLRFFIKAVDSQYETSNVTQAQDLTIVAPGFPAGSLLSSQVIDNNVLLQWPDATIGSYPIAAYRLRKGVSPYVLEDADIVGDITGTFAAKFESMSATYKYWITPIDTAGLEGESISVFATVAQPPDYVLQSSHISVWDGTLSDGAVNVGNSLVVPINTTQTWESHFTGNGWDQPSDQVSAGYPIYIQPGASSGYYEETIDYGAVIASTRITLDVTRTAVVGTVSVTPKISVKLNSGDAWTDYDNVYQVYATNFRYAKYRLDFATSDGGILLVSKMQSKLESKQKTYEGTVTANSGDSGGTSVDITGIFIDVNSIQVTPKGTTAAIAIYDFTDTPNPTAFKVLLYNTSGTRITGTVSYLIRGV